MKSISTTSAHAILLTLFVIGCGTKTGIETDPARLVDGDCVLASGAPDQFDAISVVLTESVDPAHAPIPANEAERLVFRHLYETLVTVDCQGKVHPGLASSWKESDDGRFWEFTLRENARFSDGSHITGEAVRSAWRTLHQRLEEKSGPGVSIHPDSIRTMEDRVFVSLPSSAGDEPFLFAHPGLSVVPPTGAGWPVGSGPYLLGRSAAGVHTLIPNPYHPEKGRGVSPLEVQVRPEGRARDLLSSAVDLLFIEDRSVLEFARGLEERSLHPLSWSRTYYLVSPELAFVSLNPDARESLERLKVELSRDVVSADARPASDRECDRRLQGEEITPEKPRARLMSDPLGRSTPRILYSTEDRDAGRLAERLVALALSENHLSTSSEAGVSTTFPFPLDLDSDAELVATGVGAPTLHDALAGGREWALVVSHPSWCPDPCLDRQALMRNLTWPGREMTGASSPIVPLVTTRRHLALRKGLVGVETDWNGTVLLHRAGRADEVAP